MFKRPVKGGFCVVWEATSGQLPRFDVIGNTLTADPFPGAWVIGAVTYFKVFLLVTFHACFSFLLLL